jgi:D-glycero-D-manno-heptose 1,7-bisphosphate phosphatase
MKIFRWKIFSFNSQLNKFYIRLMNKLNTFLFALIILLSFNAKAEILRQKFLNSNFDKTNNEVKVAFFDADSTLRISIQGNVTVNTPEDVFLLPMVAHKIAELAKAGYLIAIVSNQGGVSAGHVTLEQADAGLQKTIELIEKADPEAKIHYYDLAENYDSMRKPQIGMAKTLEANLKAMNLTIHYAKSYMVGDSAYKKGDIKPDGSAGVHFSNTDRLFAANLGIDFYEPTDFFGWRQYGIDVFFKIDEVRAFCQNSAPEIANDSVCASL